MGILIRSIESTASGDRIDGPSLVVDEILNCLKQESVSTVAESTDFDLSLLSDLSLDSRELIIGPRVGLHPKLEVKDTTKVNWKRRQLHKTNICNCNCTSPKYRSLLNRLTIDDLCRAF